MKNKQRFIFPLIFVIQLVLLFSCNSFSQGLNSVYSPDGNFVIAAGDAGKIIYTTNQGTRWYISTATVSNFESVFALGSKVWFAGSSGNIFTSSYPVLNLIPYSTGNGGDINSIYFVNQSTGYICSADGKIYKSINAGVNWSQQYSIASQNLNSISFKDDANGVCVGSSGIVLETTNGGANWQSVTSSTVRNLLKVKFFTGGYVIVGEYGTLLSKSTGSSIASVNSKIITDIRGVSGTSFSNTHICGGGGFIRNNGGSSDYNNFEINPELQNLVDIFYFDSNFGCAVSSMNDAVIKTTNAGASWDYCVPVNVNLSWEKKMDDQSLSSYAATIYQHPYNRSTFFAPFLNKIYVSRNNGDNWSVLSTLTPNIPVFSQTYFNNFYVSNLDTNVWIGAALTQPRNSIIRTTDYGVTWNTVKDSMTFGPFANPLEEDLSNPGTYYCAQDSGGFYKSTDNGASFQKISSQSWNIPCDVLKIPGTDIILIGNATYVTGDSVKILRSTNGGVNWSTAKKFVGQELPYFAFSQFNTSLIYASILSAKIYKSPDFGTTWSDRFENTAQPWALDVCNEDPTFISYAKYDATSYFTTNSGISFNSVSYPITTPMSSIITPERGLSLGYMNKSVYKMKIVYNVTIDVKNISTQIPDKFSLSQNYPNPFNPNTNIKFALPKTGLVKIIIYNSIGRDVKELLNENLAAGEYEVNFDGTSLTSGVYFYTLETENFTETKKMILVK